MSIYGLGGGGKTAVALELAYRMMAKHSPFLVLWVPAISRETFEIAYREIGILLRIPGITDYNADVKQLVKNSLNSGDFGDWLMVIDNADDPNVLLDSTNDDPRAGRLYDYLPRSDRGSIVFTTRDRKAAERLTQSSVLELEDMTKAEAKQLMARRIMKGTLLDDQSATNELLELLTYLPLAIVQAVAFINSNQVSISEYVSLFKRVDTEVEILSERFEDLSRYQETESTIARTWQVSFDQILKQDQLAAGYLSFMACIDRINIPQSLLPVEGTTVQRFKALGTLTGYAFIAECQQNSQQVEGERFFNVHRLVQKATVWWLKEHDNWTAWTETAYGRLKELVPYGGHEGRSIWISYLPHAIHIADLCSTLSETRRASLLDRIGRCQATLGQYTTAEETHRRVLSLRRKNVGNEEASTLTSMNEVGLALSDQGKYKEAEAMHRQTLALSEKVLSTEHPDTLASMNNLAVVLGRQGKYKEAEAMHRQTLALREVLSKEHPDTLISMNNLAAVLDLQGKYKEAEAIYRQTLALREKVLSKEHPDTLTSVYCLANLLAKQDLYDEATTLYQRVCDGYSVVLGDDHPTARACQRDYLEMLQRKEQRRPVVSSEASLTVLR
jgi:tetratricopeptide (TPR) repeat protein